jgi:hypothetical protein
VTSQSAKKRNQPDHEALQIALFAVVVICTPNQSGNPELINKQQCKETKANDLRVAHENPTSYLQTLSESKRTIASSTKLSKLLHMPTNLPRRGQPNLTRISSFGNVLQGVAQVG